ncbi:MAG TPA: hypothetical protein VNA13_01435 [Xanthomonadales bacterium]|nr:hypothetical protein [Xanthomonadales bacterium]
MDTVRSTKKSYICTGTCGAVVSEEEYNNGLTVCGAEVCTMKGQPFAEKVTETVVVDKNDSEGDVVINN